MPASLGPRHRRINKLSCCNRAAVRRQVLPPELPSAHPGSPAAYDVMTPGSVGFKAQDCEGAWLQHLSVDLVTSRELGNRHRQRGTANPCMLNSLAFRQEAMHACRARGAYIPCSKAPAPAHGSAFQAVAGDPVACLVGGPWEEDQHARQGKPKQCFKAYVQHSNSKTCAQPLDMYPQNSTAGLEDALTAVTCAQLHCTAPFSNHVSTHLLPVGTVQHTSIRP